MEIDDVDTETIRTINKLARKVRKLNLEREQLITRLSSELAPKDCGLRPFSVYANYDSRFFKAIRVGEDHYTKRDFKIMVDNYNKFLKYEYGIFDGERQWEK